tara:strand:- start:739 stop:1083 length:345 start_codon:yes stop_codon:yes gene_type:complete
MKKLDNLRLLIEKGKFPKIFPEFAGADLIITKDIERFKEQKEHHVVVYSEHAPALSWLVTKLKKIYVSEINYINKYDFYPSIGILMNNKLKRQEFLFETMLYIVDEIEKKCGTK